MADSVHCVKLPPPRTVSPFIRTARWGLLLAGVLYGATRLKFLKYREVGIQERNKKIIGKRVEDYKVWFAEEAEKSMMQLAKEAGVTPKK